MKFKKILLLAGNTTRARCYAQILADINPKFKVEGLFYGHYSKTYSPPVLNQQTNNYFNKHNFFIPDLSEDLESTFRRKDWRFNHLETSDVNSEEIIEYIKGSNFDLIIFAGYGGQILKENHFKSSINYLHMHPGELPLERGSTTIYYSLLNNRNCSVTAFLMSEKIDDGKILLCKKYPVPESGVEIDSWYDNIIRADCFKSILTKKDIEIQINDYEIEDSEEYYVIHPVLKHIALLSLNKN